MTNESEKNTCGTCGHCDLEIDNSRTIGDRLLLYCNETKEIIEDENQECCDKYE